MGQSDRDFLGRGWKFPPEFNLDFDADGQVVGEGRITMIANDADIRESLRILFSTVSGERIMEPEYGLGLPTHVFDATDETALGHLRDQIEDAILYHEPRIKLEDISFNTDQIADGCLVISLRYWIPQINSRSNMVFPYYFTEGTNISA